MMPSGPDGAPHTPPPTNEALVPPPRARLQERSSTRGLYLLIALFVALAIVRTLAPGAPTRSVTRAAPDLDALSAALSETKLAYTEADAIRVRPQARRSKGALQVERSAAAAWRKLAGPAGAPAGMWRRLGITLGLFNLPGALKALTTAASAPESGAPLALNTNPIPPRPRLPYVSIHKPPSNAPAAAVQPVKPRPAELQLWTAIYGSYPLPPSRAPALRRELSALHLGWFEQVAAARLYARAGLPALARKAAASANWSAVCLSIVSGVQATIVFVGALLLVLLTLRFGDRWSSLRGLGPVGSNSDRLVPVPDTASFRGPGARRQARTLLVAFVIYLAAQELISLALAIVLMPFSDRLVRLAPVFLMRLEVGIQLGMYLPIFLIPVLVLRSEWVQSGLSSRVTLRRFLAALGLSGRGATRDAASGILGYVLAMPVVLFMTVVSSLIYAHVHTPSNPADSWIAAANGWPDRLLVLFVASVAAPIVEETMFRGMLYPALRSQLGVIGGILLSAAIFAAVHPTLPAGFLPILAVGAGLAAVREWRGSLVPGMVLHGVFNGLIALNILLVFAR